ncbi:hypothetical protein B0H17DRAFT_1085063 [Mycena rosella]|uniref:NmrA-like domain-containing protein n=1 Tax=Mycena rosella TaxID=1033263 RepID=A0AAD7D0V9_MYCRO|nr:hypothetical protein B0H17DRAFT_1085063 [Mycena rosella]
MSSTNIFITGATGYLGGTLISALLDRKDSASFDITALVRSAEKAEKLKNATGINIAMGSHSDLELIETLASKADVILSMGDCDDLELAKAQLRGAKRRYEATGTLSVFIHASGVGCLADDAFGMYGPKDLIGDIDTETIAALPIDQPHRSVDVEIVKADKQGYVKTYIVAPGTIYGTATGKVADAGAQNTYNKMMDDLCLAGFLRKEAFIFGEGKNEWAHVEIGELVDLIMLLYDAIVAKPEETAHGTEGYYFAENGAYALFELADVLQKVLVETGHVKAGSKGPTHFSTEELKLWSPVHIRMLGGNVRCKSSRSRSLGWNPVKTHCLETVYEQLMKFGSKLPLAL